MDVAGCSAAWLARMVWDHEVGGSNPPTPTNLNIANFAGSLFARSPRSRLPVRSRKAKEGFFAAAIFRANEVGAPQKNVALVPPSHTRATIRNSLYFC